MAILRSRFVMTTHCDYLKTSVFITVAAITGQFTGIYAHKPQ